MKQAVDSVWEMEQHLHHVRCENQKLKSINVNQQIKIKELEAAIDYQKAVWAQFDSELSKNLKKDTALYKQISATTASLLQGEKIGFQFT